MKAIATRSGLCLLFPRCPILFLVLAVALGVTTAPASAQGTFNTVPDPIDSRELDDYAERLGLSPQQRQLISEHHREYLEQFRELRERDIEEFLGEMRTLRRGFDMSNLPVMERLVRTAERLMRRIEQIDESFFNDIQSTLTDEQANKLPRVRLTRARARYGNEMTRGIDFINPGVRVDLVEFVEGLDLSPREMERIDPILISYEQRLTRGAKDVFEASTTMMLEAMREMDRAGFTDPDLEQRQVMMQMFQHFQEIWADLTEDLMEETKKVTDLHRRTFRDLSQLLPEEPARELRRMYLGQAYPQAAQIGRPAERQFTTVLESDGLDERTRRTVEELLAGHRQQQDRAADQMMDLLDRQRQDLSLAQIARQSEGEFRQRIEELTERARQQDQTAVSTLHGVIGAELAAALNLDETIEAESDRGSRWRQAMRRGGGGGGGRPGAAQRDMTELRREMKPETSLPGPIDQRDLQRFRQQTGLSTNQADLLGVLHDSYRQGYQEINRSRIAPLLLAVREYENPRGEAAERMPDAEEILKIIDLHQEAVEAIVELEEQFFSDLSAALAGGNDGQDLEQPITRWELARRRAAFAPLPAPGRIPGRGAFGGPGGMGAMFTTASEAAIDVAGLLSELNIRPDQDALHEALLDYEFEVTDIFAEKFEIDRELQKAFASMRAGGDGDRRNRGRQFGRVMRDLGASSREVNEAIVVNNRYVLDQLLGGISPENARYVREQYNRRAFPQVYNDPDSVNDTLGEVLALESLSDRQRMRVQELSLEYRVEYAALSEQMVELIMSGDDEGDWRQRARGRSFANPDFSRIEQLRFERRELSERARRQLQSILTEQQRGSLGIAQR